MDQRQSRFLGQGDELLDRIETALIGHLSRHDLRTQAVGQGPALAVAPGEQALGQRAPHQYAHAVALADWQHLALDAAVKDGIGRLLRAETGKTALLCHPLGLDDFGGGKGRRADGADLAGPHQVGQGRKSLLDVGIRRRSVNLVEVDMICLEAPEGALDRLHDPAPRIALHVWIVAHGTVNLGRDHDIVPPSLERLAEDHLGFAGAVAIGRVDEIDAGIERLVDHAGTVVMVGIAHGPEHHGAEAIGTDLDAGPAEGAVLHGGLLSGCHSATGTPDAASICSLIVQSRRADCGSMEREVISAGGLTALICRGSSSMGEMSLSRR